MREIKFRLLKGGKIVGYEKHVLPVGKVHIFHSVLNDDNPGYEWRLIWHKPKTNCIEHDDKEQFTGLYDKNGKEIYEGDIIEWTGFGDTKKYTVVYYNGGFSGEKRKGEYIDLGLMTGLTMHSLPCEIIGNIHEKEPTK